MVLFGLVRCSKLLGGQAAERRPAYTPLALCWGLPLGRSRPWVGSAKGSDVKTCESCNRAATAGTLHDAVVLSGLHRLARLSPRERDVFALLGDGPSNRDISQVLFISERRVKAHLASIQHKLAMSSRLQVCMVALLHDLRSGRQVVNIVPEVNGGGAPTMC